MDFGNSALSVSETPESIALAQEVAENLIAHKSIPVSHAAESLGYLGNDIYIVGFLYGNGFAVIDAVSGVALYSEPELENDGNCMVTVSPDMRYFAVYPSVGNEPGEIRFYRWINGTAELVSAADWPTEAFGCWIGEDAVLAIADQQICQYRSSDRENRYNGIRKSDQCLEKRK